jgi:hypothetical protein
VKRIDLKALAFEMVAEASDLGGFTRTIHPGKRDEFHAPRIAYFELLGEIWCYTRVVLRIFPALS